MLRRTKFIFCAVLIPVVLAFSPEKANAFETARTQAGVLSCGLSFAVQDRHLTILPGKYFVGDVEMNADREQDFVIPGCKTVLETVPLEQQLP